MIDPIVRELIVLQIIYALLLPKVTQETHSDGSGNSNSSNSSSESHNNSNTDDTAVISSNIKLSLVKLTNEIQNNVLINEIMSVNDPMNKLNINDILSTIKELFPLQRIVLTDGQLSFHNLKIIDIKGLIMEKFSIYRSKRIEYIKQLDYDIVKMVSNIEANETNKKIRSSSNSSSNNSIPSDTAQIKVQIPGGVSTTKSRTATPEGPITMKNMDPKREKLLQLYRDTVLNKLQSKNKILDKLYTNLERNPNNQLIVRELLNLEKIKTTTPVSVNNLQLILQKSVSDGIMSSTTGGHTWTTARQLQTELDDTVQFMRRALE